jgi:biopolymer transport protein TolR
MSSFNKYQGRKSTKLMSDINVTPFVDVMLVLLIVFMITAPLLKTGIEIELPEIDTPNIAEKEDPLIITITKKNETFISEKKLDTETLNNKLIAVKKVNPKIQVYIRADKTVTYDELMKVMKQIISSGITNVSLITLPKK